MLHQIYEYTSVLRWLREILVLRNAFLLHHKDNAYLGSNIPMAKHALTKLEIVFFIYLWSIEPEALKIAMSCFALFAYDADIRFGFDETAVLALLPNYNPSRTSFLMHMTCVVILTKNSCAMDTFWGKSSGTNSSSRAWRSWRYDFSSWIIQTRTRKLSNDKESQALWTHLEASTWDKKFH